jgi:hypothetical protein
MDTPRQASLTPEQLAAVNAGGGFAQFVDPTSNFVYYLIKQTDPPTIDEDYIREKLAEADSDIEQGNYVEWNIEELKHELRERLAVKQTRQ